MPKTTPKTNRISKNAGKTRTSMWLDDGLRAQIDERCDKERRSLGFMIDALLRKALGRAPRARPEADAEAKTDAPIFG